MLLVSHRRAVFPRLLRLLRRKQFRRHPVKYLWRRLRFPIHWMLRPRKKLIVPFYGGLRCSLAPSSVSLGIYIHRGPSNGAVARDFIDVLRPGMVAFDCGAHIGEYTLLFSSLVGPSGHVHSFDPDPRIFAYLQENIRLNNLANVTLNNVALSDHDGHAMLVLQADATTSFLEEPGNLAPGVNPAVPFVDHAASATLTRVGKMSVDVLTLDSYVRTRRIARVDALKLNVEGAAERVLAGGRRLLSELRPALVEVECDGDVSPSNIVGMFSQLGFATEIRTATQLYPWVIARQPIA
jgi:FkbM family methyltransferase